MSAIQGILLTDFGDFLSWNRYMILGLSMWTLLVAFVQITTTDGSQCSANNSFAGVVWIVGLTLLFFTVLAEFSTDIQQKRSNAKKEKTVWGKNSHDITWRSIIWRFFSNILLFYVLIAIGSYNWFPDNSGCFIPWTSASKNESLIVSGSLAFLFLLLRVLMFNYESIPQDKRVATILEGLVIKNKVEEYDFGKELSKIDTIITNFGVFAKRLKRRQAYFNQSGVLYDQASINGASHHSLDVLEEPDYHATDRATIELALEKMKVLAKTLNWLDNTFDEFVSNPIPVRPIDAKWV